MDFIVAIEKNFKFDSLKVSLATKESKKINDQQAVFKLVRKLVHAELELSDKELTSRLWKDVADKGIDLDRVINLMFSCSIHEDDNEMIKVDEIYQRTGLVG